MQKTTIAAILFFLVLGVSSPARADISKSMCQAYMPVIEQAISFRNSGIPLENATDMADSAFDTNRSLYRFLVGAIRSAYRDPKSALEQLRSGRTQQLCEQAVRGY